MERPQETLQQVPENQSGCVERPVVRTGPELHNGCSESDCPAPKCDQCSPVDQPSVVSLMLADHHDDDEDHDIGVAVPLKTADNGKERHGNSDVASRNRNQSSENTEDSLVALMESATLRDTATTETTKLTARAPVNGVSTNSSDGSHSSKYRRPSHEPGDGASVTGVAGIMASQFGIATQPLPAALGHPYSPSFSQNVAEQNMASLYLMRPQRIPGPSPRSDCRFVSAPCSLPSYVQEQSQIQTSPGPVDIAMPWFRGNRLVTAQSSIACRNPACLPVGATLYLPAELPEISPDDVKNILDDPFSHSAANIPQMRTQNGDAVGRFPITETVQDTAGTILYPLPVTAPRMRMPNIYSDAVPAQMRLTTLPHHVQRWSGGTSIEVQVDSPSPVSSGRHRASSLVSPSSVSDTSQYISDEASPVAAASSCGDSSDIAHMTLVNPARSSTGSGGGGGGPEITTDDGREPSPCDDSAFPFSPTPPEQPVSDESDLYKFICDMNEEIVRGNSANPNSVASCLNVEIHEQRTAEKRAFQLSRSELLCQNDDGDTVLHSALIHEEAAYAAALIERLDELRLIDHVINTRNHMQQTPFCLAVITNQWHLVERLLQLGSDVTTQIVADGGQQMPAKRQQPLHFAASKGRPWLNTLRAILQSPYIDIDVFNSDGRTALHCAVESHGKGTSTLPIDATDNICLLVDHGANLNKPDGQSDRTPLHYAIESRNVELVRRLLELAVTPAALAAATRRSPDTSRCSTSLEAAMLGARTGTGNAALHLAVSVRHMAPSDKRRLVQLLLSKGADPSARNGEGQLPREMTNDQEIVGLLRGRAGHGR